MNEITIMEFKKLKQKDNVTKNKDLTKPAEPTVKKIRRFQKHRDNFYYIDYKKYEKLFGTRQEVWDSIAYMTSGQLIKEHLVINHSGKVVSKIKSEENINNPRGICKPRNTKISIVE